LLEEWDWTYYADHYGYSTVQAGMNKIGRQYIL